MTEAKPPIGCAKCDARWGGVNTAHCGGCHTTWSGLSAFDKHRAGSHTKGRHCLDPEAATEQNPESANFGEKLFKESGRKYPCWGLPGDGGEWWA